MTPYTSVRIALYALVAGLIVLLFASSRYPPLARRLGLRGLWVLYSLVCIAFLGIVAVQLWQRATTP